jgi:hypothetical protein
MVALSSCVKDKLTSVYITYEPVVKTKAAVWAQIKSAPARGLETTGKLVLYGNYIFINEVNKGVHIINNQNPAAPQNIGFINIPGNIDIALKNNILYADVFSDMVMIDVSNPNNVQLKGVEFTVFPERVYNQNFTVDTGTYIIDWIKHEARNTIEINTLKQQAANNGWLEGNIRGMAVNTMAQGDFSGSKVLVGVSGSMARFTIVDNHLYTVGRSELTAFNISNAVAPVKDQVTNVGWNIETVYPFNGKLFIGGQNGMFIYDIANPAAPQRLGMFSHACFNDPVVANNTHAFVTLRALTPTVDVSGVSIMPITCRGNAPQQNQLDIVDVNNLMAPSLVKTYEMTEPMGISLDGNYLFLCDGKGGLKLFDVSNVNQIRLHKALTNINPFEVIAFNKKAIVVAKGGLYQFDYSDINNIRQISKIAVQ